MARDPSGVSRRHLRTLFDAGVATGLTDGQLLERFTTRSDGDGGTRRKVCGGIAVCGTRYDEPRPTSTPGSYR